MTARASVSFVQKAVSDEALIAVLGRCYAGGQQESRLEEFLIRTLPHLEEDRYLVYPASVMLYRNYFYAAERSQYAGLIDDARRLYTRFVDLGRILNRDTALGVEMHRHLNRASVRLKTLAAEHAFETEAVRKIQDGPAEAAATFIDHRDPRLAALARYNTASFLWHDDKRGGGDVSQRIKRRLRRFENRMQVPVGEDPRLTG